MTKTLLGVLILTGRKIHKSWSVSPAPTFCPFPGHPGGLSSPRLPLATLCSVLLLPHSVEVAGSYLAVGSNPTKEICRKWWKSVPRCCWQPAGLALLLENGNLLESRCSAVGKEHWCWYPESLFLLSNELSFSLFPSEKESLSCWRCCCDTA